MHWIPSVRLGWAQVEAQTEAQIAEMVEQRGEERAAELYAARVAAEKAAVGAEFRVDRPGPERPPAGQLSAAEAIEEGAQARGERADRRQARPPGWLVSTGLVSGLGGVSAQETLGNASQHHGCDGRPDATPVGDGAC
jgi:hypothetical protein